MKVIKPLQFEWDQGNNKKNLDKHNVSLIECEELFFNSPFYFPDVKHSETETRYIALGETKKKRLLTICFTYRNKKIRVISARYQHKKEKLKYFNMIKERVKSLLSK